MDTSNEGRQDESVTRNADYLWDRSGGPNPEIERLEKLLGKFRHDGRALELPDNAAARPGGWFAWRNWKFPVLATAVAAISVAAVIFLPYSRKPDAITVAGWEVSGLSGTPRIGRNVVGTKETNRLGVGQVLETDQLSRARLRAEDTGQIEMEQSSRLRLMSIGGGMNRIALDRGTIQVYIWAPPGQFVVDTPSATTVDLGCAYKLQVDDAGAGLVRTSLGWVGFKLNGHESFIPAGAACATRPKVGPGTPYFEDAPAKFRAALERFDFEDSTREQRAADVAIVLDASRKRDALTLWHLLARVDEAQRARVYDRLREIAPPPAVVTRQGILRLDQPMLDRWWNKLGFDDISVWRHWERSWSGASKPAPEK